MKGRLFFVMYRWLNIEHISAIIALNITKLAQKGNMRANIMERMERQIMFVQTAT